MRTLRRSHSRRGWPSLSGTYSPKLQPPNELPSDGDLLDKGRRSTLATLVQKVATPVLTFAVTVILARNLEQREYGVYGLLQGAVKYVALLTSLGLPFVVQRFVPEFSRTGREGAAREVVWKALVIRGTAIVVVSAGILAAFGPIGAFFKIEQYRSLFAVFLLGVALYLEAGILLQALNSLFLHAYAVGAQIAYACAKAVLLGALLVVGFTLTNVVIVEVISFGLLVTVYAAAYRHRFSSRVRRVPLVPDESRRVYRYGAFSILNELGTTFFDESTDFLIIGHFLSTTALAPYFLATQVARYFGKLNIANQFQGVFTPLFFAAYTDDDQRIDRMFRFLVKLSLFLMMPALIGFLLLGKTGLVLVFGARYDTAYAVTAILLAFVPVSATSLASGLVLQSLEKVDHLLYSRVFALYNLIVNVLLVQRFGILGVAVGTASAVLLKNAYCLYWAIRLGHVRLPYGSLGRLAVNSAVSGIVVYGLRGVVRGIPSLVLVACVGVVVFLGASYFDKVFSAEEASIIDRVAGRRLWIF